MIYKDIRGFLLLLPLPPEQRGLAGERVFAVFRNVKYWISPCMRLSVLLSGVYLGRNIRCYSKKGILPFPDFVLQLLVFQSVPKL